jgi:AraC-like DNA-binding protein
MKLYIKNMVCHRCIVAVRQELEKSGLYQATVQLGEVELAEELPEAKLKSLGESLLTLGFEILDDQKQKQIEKIKNLIVNKVQSGEIEEHFSIIHFIGNALHKDYTALSRLFSAVEGITIEQFLILQKIEKVKEWLVYNELTLSEIAWKLGYSSVAHLSSQFKRITGLTPSQLKKLGNPQRKSLDNIKP